MSLLSATDLSAQIDIMFHLESDTCTTDSCDVEIRQYTGLYTGWTLKVRCLGAAGWGDYHIWEGSGVYSGSLCNGAL